MCGTRHHQNGTALSLSQRTCHETDEERVAVERDEEGRVAVERDEEGRDAGPDLATMIKLFRYCKLMDILCVKAASSRR